MTGRLIERLDGPVAHVWTIRLEASIHPTRVRAEARARCREILARYLETRPDEVPIFRPDGGKPFVCDTRDPPLQFSMSHSGDFALLGIACRQRIGIDLERLRPLPRAEALAARFFTPDEALRIARAPISQLAFLKTWVLKEAYLKGIGGSVPAGLGRFEIALDELGAARVARTELENGSASAWSLAEVDSPDGFVGALAVEGDTTQIETFTD